MVSKFKALLVVAGCAALLVSCSTKEAKREYIPITKLEDVFTNLSPMGETFEINPKEEVLLKGKEGTAIYIPADAFQFADGTTPTGKVSIELKECYSLADMIGENLSTTSGHQLLQTGGMINIKALADGKELMVKDGKAFVVGFPKNGGKDTMDLFYDVNGGNGNNTWVPDYNTPQKKASAPGELSISGSPFSEGGVSYPIEVTEDMYDLKLSTCLWTVVFLDIKLSGLDKTLLDYIEDGDPVSLSIANAICNDSIEGVHYSFRIDSKGKMYNLKVENNDDGTISNEILTSTQNFLENAPDFDLSTLKDKSRISLDWKFEIGLSCRKVFNVDRYKAKFREKYAIYNDKAVQKLDKEALDFYTFSATNLGWINCDKFWDTQDEKINFVVKIPNPKDSKVMIVFSDINSIMNGTLDGDKMVFNNVPVNRKIKVIGISYSNGKPTMNTVYTTVKKETFELNSFKEFTLDELEAELNKKS